MTIKRPEAELKSSEGGITSLQDQYFSRIMDARTTRNPSPMTIHQQRYTPSVEGKRTEYRLPFSPASGKRIFPVSYFSLESFLFLVCLTASLLILPLILPPLPPPPFMLLLLPICIFAVLMILAFTPTNTVRGPTSRSYTYI